MSSAIIKTIMRSIILYLFCIGTIASHAQSKKIWTINFSDDSIFEMFRRNFSDFPQRYVVSDKSIKWDPRRFWLEEIQQLSADSIRRLEGDEHHPYNFIYLFSDTSLERHVSNAEKRKLSKKAQTAKEKRIAITAENCIMANDINGINGYYFQTTKPIFTSDASLAFIDVYCFYNDPLVANGTADQHLLGRICVVYQKQSDGLWKKLKVWNLLTL